MDWVAFKNQFFSAVMIAKDNFATGAKLKSTPLESLLITSSTMRLT